MFTLKVQEAPTASVAPDKPILFDPAVAVIAPPPQVPVSPFGVATKRPAGSGSVKLTFVNGVPVLLVIVSVDQIVGCRHHQSFG